MKYTVTVQDGSGNPVDGATVNISDDVQGTCPSPLPTTNSSGQATYTTTVPSGEASGTYDIVFSASDNGYTDSAWVTRQVEVPAAGITDQQKENAILAMVNDHRGALPRRICSGGNIPRRRPGAFYVDGSNYNSFYNASDAPWAQPTNGDGIMQVTSASGYHQLSGTYTNDQTGYDHAISDGCAYLDANFSQYGTVWQTALHYNTGPNSLYIYLGRNEGTRNYLSDVASDLQSLVPPMFSISNASLVSELNEAQTILNGYLNNSNILSGQSVSYYASYQTQLESALSNIGVANQPPSVSYIATPSGTQSGNVTISYGLADANSDTCSIAVQYSPDGGSTLVHGDAGVGRQSNIGPGLQRRRHVVYLRLE